MTSKSVLPLPLAGEGRGEGKPCERREGRGEGKPCERREGRGEGKPLSATLLLVLTFAACGNYSNEDLEFLNAVPAAQDISADIPRAPLLANEAEMAKLTHDTVAVFNGALKFLEAADVIRTYPATSRIANGRIWGPVPMDDHPGWQWRFIVTREPARPDVFNYSFDVERVGGGPTDWIPFIYGSFAAVAGQRKGSGEFHMTTDALTAAGFDIAFNLKGEKLRVLDVTYSTESFPIHVEMHVEMYKDWDYVSSFTVDIAYGAQESGQGALDFDATDSDGNSISVTSGWLATGRGRADATVTAGTLVDQTRTQCWNDSFEETYNHADWAPLADVGDPSLCPDISNL
jgi:hypothetical protein